MNVVIIGTGYVGLVSGVCLAAKGHQVICVDKNPLVVNALNAGEPHIFETGLPELLKQVRGQGLFLATGDLYWAMDRTDLVIVAVRFRLDAEVFSNGIFVGKEEIGKSLIDDSNML